MNSELLDACLRAVREADAPMTATQIGSAARGGKKPNTTLIRELEQELSRVPKEAGVAEWPAHGRSRLFWTKSFRQAVEECLVKALEREPMTLPKAAKPVSKLLGRASEARTLAELKTVAPQLASTKRILQVSINRQSVVYLSFEYLAPLMPTYGEEDSIEKTILQAVEQLQSGPEIYVRVDHLRNTTGLRSRVDRAIIGLADKGQLVLGRYDGPRPVHNEDKWKYIEDLGGDVFSGVSFPEGRHPSQSRKVSSE